MLIVQELAYVNEWGGEGGHLYDNRPRIRVSILLVYPFTLRVTIITTITAQRLKFLANVVYLNTKTITLYSRSV